MPRAMVLGEAPTGVQLPLGFQGFAAFPDTPGPQKSPCTVRKASWVGDSALPCRDLSLQGSACEGRKIQAITLGTAQKHPLVPGKDLGGCPRGSQLCLLCAEMWCGADKSVALSSQHCPRGCNELGSNSR